MTSRCSSKPPRKIPGLPFGLVTNGGDRSYNNLAVADTLSVGSEAVIPTAFLEEIAARQNLDITVCEEVSLAANHGTFSFENNFILAANDASIAANHDLNLTAVNNILIAANNIQISGNLATPNVHTCTIACPNGNLQIESNNNIFLNSSLATFNNNVHIDGTLNVCNLDCTGTLNLDAPNISINNDLTVNNILYTTNLTSNTTLNVNSSLATFNNNVNIDGTLNVCNLTCIGNLNVNAVQTTFNNDVNVNGTLNVCNLTCIGNLNVNATQTTFNNNVNVNGTLNVCNLTCIGNLNVNAVQTTFNNNVNIDGTLNVCNLTCNGNLNVNATQTTFNNNVNIDGALNVCNLTCNGNLNVTAGNLLNINSIQTTFNNNVKIDGSLNVCTLDCNGNLNITANNLVWTAGNIIYNTALVSSSQLDTVVGYSSALKQFTDITNALQIEFEVYATIPTVFPAVFPGTNIRFNVVVNDPFAVFNTTTNSATMPLNGYYIFGGTCYTSALANYIYLAVNGNSNDRIWGAGQIGAPTVTGGMRLLAGDVVTICSYGLSSGAIFRRLTSFWMKRIRA